MKFTEDDLSMLTEDERRLLEEEDADEHDDDDTDADDDADDDAGDDDDDTDADDDAGDSDSDDDDSQSDGDDDAGDEGGEGQNGDDAGDGGQDEDGEGDDKVTAQPQPLFKAEIPADLEAKRTALDEKEDELDKQFDEGDITFTEHKKALREINRERSDLDRAVLKAELAQEAHQAQIANNWQSNLNAFMEDHPEIDLSNEIHHTVFDKLLREVTAPIMEKGGVPGLREIKLAHKKFAETFNLQAKDDKQTDTGKQTKQTKEQPKPKKKADVPPTLAKVPAASNVDMDDGHFAHLDRLGPAEFQKAFNKLSPADQEAYLASS